MPTLSWTPLCLRGILLLSVTTGELLQNYLGCEAAHAAYGGSTGEQVSHYLGQKWGILQLPQTATPPTRTTTARTLIKVYATVLSSNGLNVPPDEHKILEELSSRDTL